MFFKIESEKVVSGGGASFLTQAQMVGSRDFGEGSDDLYVIVSAPHSFDNQKRTVDFGGEEKGQRIENIILARNFFSDFGVYFFEGGDELEPDERLKKAASSICKKYKKKFGEFEVACFCLHQNHVFMTSYGGAQIRLFRDGSLITLVRSGTEGKLTSASGEVKEGDLFILSTSLFFENLSNYHRELKTLNLNEIAKNFTSKEEAVQKDFATFFLKVVKLQPTTPELLGVEKLSKVKPTSFIRSEIGKIVDKIPQRKISIRRQTDRMDAKSKKTSVSVGFILIMLLVVSIIFGIKNKKETDIKEKYTQVLDQAKHELEEAELIYLLNPQRSRELFFQSKISLDDLTSQGIIDPTLAELNQKMLTIKAEILGEHEVSTELFLDLSLLSSGFNGDFVVGSKDDVFVLDSNSEKVAKVEISTKRSEIVAGPSQIDDPKGITNYAERVFIVERDGIFEVGDRKEKVIEKDWEDEPLIYAYAGNIYLIDKGSSKIFRFVGFEGGFSSKRDWLAKEMNVDLSNAVDMAVDGAIWVLTKEGEIMKFTYGNLQNFGISEVFPELVKPLAIYTNEELDYLYILDSENSRVVVIDKEGKYKAQYLTEGIRDAKGIVVSEEESIILLLTGERLVSIEIKHLE